jgi:chloramphenicol-sensitive protein RarD
MDLENTDSAEKASSTQMKRIKIRMISEHLRTSAISVRMRSSSVCLMAVRKMTDVCGTIGDMTRGYLYAITAYVLWGFFPIYWKQLGDVPAGEIILHRILWSLAFLLGLGLMRRRWGWLRELYRHPRRTLILAVAALFLATNWLVYVWGVNHGFVVQASLGYFITPLISVLLGVVLLGERLRRMQWLAVGLAAVGVLYLMLGVGEIPWVAFALAFSFGLYGFSKKKMHLEAIEGLTAEMMILALPAALLLAGLTARGESHFSQNLSTLLLLAGGGAVTATPLLFFGAAARRIPLSALGVMQFIAPLLQFLIGVFLYHEPFDLGRFIGFSIIWMAVILFIIDNVRAQQASPAGRLTRPGQVG